MKFDKMKFDEKSRACRIKAVVLLFSRWKTHKGYNLHYEESISETGACADLVLRSPKDDTIRMYKRGIEIARVVSVKTDEGIKTYYTSRLKKYYDHSRDWNLIT